MTSFEDLQKRCDEVLADHMFVEVRKDDLAALLAAIRTDAGKYLVTQYDAALDTIKKLRATLAAKTDVISPLTPQEIEDALNQGHVESMIARGDNSFTYISRMRDEAIAERNTAHAERDTYRSMLCDVIASAHPHPDEHPTMTKAWERARELLKNGPTKETP
jgi:hypothetical protein